MALLLHDQSDQDFSRAIQTMLSEAGLSSTLEAVSGGGLNHSIGIAPELHPSSVGSAASSCPIIGDGESDEATLKRLEAINRDRIKAMDEEHARVNFRLGMARENLKKAEDDRYNTEQSTGKLRDELKKLEEQVQKFKIKHQRAQNDFDNSMLQRTNKMKEMAVEHSQLLSEIEAARQKQADIEAAIAPAQRDLERIESGMRHAEAQHSLAVSQKAEIMKEIKREKATLRRLDDEVHARQEEIAKAKHREREEREKRRTTQPSKSGGKKPDNPEFVSEYQHELESLRAELAAVNTEKATMQRERDNLNRERRKANEDLQMVREMQEQARYDAEQEMMQILQRKQETEASWPTVPLF